MSFKSALRSQRSTGYQILENRLLLAGDVTVFEAGHLFLRGDGAGNQVQVVVDGDQLRVEGLNGTTINHQDSYVVQGATLTQAGVSFEGGIRANLGEGHDTLEIRDALFESKSVVYGGAGDDIVDLVDSQFLEHITIQTFDGDDTVSTTGSQFNGDFYVFTLDGEDSVTSIETAFNEHSIVVTGEHSDTVHSADSHYLGEVNLILSLNGNDEVQLIDPVVGANELGVYLGNDHDTVGVDLDEAVVESTIKIAGQAGVDSPTVMTMSDEVADKTTVTGIEKGELVFESALGGIENVTDLGNISFTTTHGFEGFDADINVAFQKYATPVVLETTQTIKQFEWSGVYIREFFNQDLPDLGDNFIIEILEDAGDGAPDVDSSTIFEVGEANRILAGEVETDFFRAAPLYSYHAEIEYTIEAGKQYWVSIYTELDEVETAQANYWNWGLGEVDVEFESTLYNGGDNVRATDWRFNEDPYFTQGVLDLRLRV